MKVFPGYKFYPLAQLSENVPILTCGAISKRLVIISSFAIFFFIEILLLKKKSCVEKLKTSSNNLKIKKKFLGRIILQTKIESHVHVD